MGWRIGKRSGWPALAPPGQELRNGAARRCAWRRARGMRLALRSADGRQMRAGRPCSSCSRTRCARTPCAEFQPDLTTPASRCIIQGPTALAAGRKRPRWPQASPLSSPYAFSLCVSSPCLPHTPPSWRPSRPPSSSRPASSRPVSQSRPASGPTTTRCGCSRPTRSWGGCGPKAGRRRPPPTPPLGLAGPAALPAAPSIPAARGAYPSSPSSQDAGAAQQVAAARRQVCRLRSHCRPAAQDPAAHDRRRGGSVRGARTCRAALLLQGCAAAAAGPLLLQVGLAVGCTTRTRRPPRLTGPTLPEPAPSRAPCPARESCPRP